MADNYRINNLPPYLLGELGQEIVDSRLAGLDVIDLSSANPNMIPPGDAVNKLVQASLLPHNHRYSASSGIKKLREEFAKSYRDRFFVELDIESEVVVTMGTKEGLAHLLLAIGLAGENVIIPVPSYPVHNAAIFIAQAAAIGVSLFGDSSISTSEKLLESSFHLSASSEGFFQRLISAVESTWPRPRVLLLSFPHNPTTAIVDHSFFERIVKFAKENSLIVVHDFSYADICFDSYRPPSILQVEGSKDVCVEFYSLSKGLGVSGWRVGVCVGNSQLVNALKRIKSYIDFGLFQPLQIASVEVLKHSREIALELTHLYCARRDAFVVGLRNLGFEVITPQATLFVWAKIPEKFREMGSLGFSKMLLREAKVAASPGVGYGSEGDNFLRFALVEDEARLRKALVNLKKVLCCDAV